MEALLALVKQLLGIASDDTSKDTLLNHFIGQARLAACTYCNVDALPETYDGTIADLAVYLYQNRDSVGVVTKRQGERTVTYEEGNIPNHILSALPLPRVRVVDV